MPNRSSDESTITKLISLIPDSQLRKIVEEALSHRPEASSAVRQSLDELLGGIKIKGFRSGSKAPLMQQVSEICRIAKRHNFVTWCVLRSWMEANQPLQDEVRRELAGTRFSLYVPSQLSPHLSKLDAEEFRQLTDSIHKNQNSCTRDEVGLMVCCVTARYVASPDDTFVDDDIEKIDTATEQEQFEQKYSSDNEGAVSLEKWLNRLEGLPPEAPEWDQLEDFAGRILALAERHNKIQKIDGKIADIKTDFGDLIQFFKYDCSTWAANNLQDERLDPILSRLETLSARFHQYVSLRNEPTGTLLESRKQRQGLEELEDAIESSFKTLADELSSPAEPATSVTALEAISLPTTEVSHNEVESNDRVAIETSAPIQTEAATVRNPERATLDDTQPDARRESSSETLEQLPGATCTPVLDSTNGSTVEGNHIKGDPLSPPDVQLICLDNAAVTDPSVSTPQEQEAKKGRSLDEDASLGQHVWDLIARDRISLAYQINRCIEQLSIETKPSLPGSMVLKALALSRSIQHSAGDAVELLTETVEVINTDLAALLSQPYADQEAAALLLFAASLRPTLIAPASQSSALLETLPLADRFSPLDRLRQAVLSYLRLGVELTPAFLKGRREHDVWLQDFQQFRDECDRWLREKRQAKIIYAPTTEVWRNWLEPQGPLGKLLAIIIENKRDQLSLIRNAVNDWADSNVVYERLNRTDKELRQRAANRRPIEARAKQAIFKHTQEAVARFRQWLDLLNSEPHSERQFVHEEAEKRRTALLSDLAVARARVREVAAKNGDLRVAAACLAVGRSLEDVARMFDPSTPDKQKPLSGFFQVCCELMKIPGMVLDERWNPVTSNLGWLLDQLLALTSLPETDWVAAFRQQSRSKNHLLTQRIIELLQDSPHNDVDIEPLRLEREENLKFCISELRTAINEVQSEIGRMVTYGLLPESALLNMRAKAESINPDDVLQFGPEYAKLDEIRATLRHSRNSQIEEVRSRLFLGAGKYAPTVLERIKVALDAGEIHAANEYLDMADSGETLPLQPKEDTFSSFFPSFVAQIIQFLNGPDNKRERPDARSLIADVKEGRSVGPLDMRNTSAEQADEAGHMLEAWFRLKNRMNDLNENLASFFSLLGFENVRINRTEEPADKKWWGELQCSPIADRAICVVAQFGSLARGRYQLLCLWDRPSEEEIINTAGKRAAQSPTIVLYLGSMVENRRRDLAHLARERRRPFQVLLIDETVVLFLCGQGGARLPVLVKCTAPFAFVNPYTTTAGLVPVEMFFGRSRERHSVIDRFGTNLVYGGRQLGKTALLRDVERHYDDPSKGSIVKWIDLRSEGIGVSRPIDEIWSVLAGTLLKSGVLKNPISNPETLSKRVSEWLAEDPTRRIVLLLDETDAFLESEGKHDFQNLSRLKGLMDLTDRRFKVVFAGLHNVQRTSRHINTPLAHLGRAICIGPLLDDGEHAEALALITEPLEMLGYRFETADLPVRILSHTNYYPSLIQLYCKHLLDHLANPRRQFFSRTETPVYKITSRHLEEAQNQELRAAVLDRFRLTLDLDARYRLIALCIALHSAERRQEDALVKGVDVSWVRDDALSWWSEGFKDDTSLEGFRTILDEMIGLGILRQAEGKRYALRSPNLLNLLGTRTEIENELLDASTKEPPTPYEASTFHRSLPDDPWRRSPLTAEQESQILSDGNGVAIIFGTRLGGMGEVKEFLRAAANSATLICPTDVFTLEDFVRMLREPQHADRDGQTVILLTEDTPWTDDWVHRSLEELKRRKSKKKSLRVLFLADTKKGWTWTRLTERDTNDISSAAITEISLKPWSDSALRNWIYDIGLTTTNSEGFKRITEVTGNWSLLLHELGIQSRSGTHRWKEHLENIESEWLATVRTSPVFDLIEEAVPLLRTMAMLNESVTAEDLCHLEPRLSKSLVSRVLKWADRFSIVACEGQSKWRLDPVIRRLLILG
jgi:hypothetical protein